MINSLADLGESRSVRLRSLLDRAFGEDPEEGFADTDWEHALGGQHFLIEDGLSILAHAAVVPRVLKVGGTSWATGYVEAVATEPVRQGEGWGTKVMEAASSFIRETYELGALGTDSFHFYERLGWERWTGPMAVRTDTGLLPTPEDQGFLMILRTPESFEIDPAELITCEWRPGDVW